MLQRLKGKFNLLMLVLLSTHISVLAQEPATIPGYVITRQDDSIDVQIKLPKSKIWGNIVLSKFLEEVEIAGSAGSSKTYKPGDIIGFGFIYQGLRYRLLSKPIKNGSLKFLQPVVTGKNTSMYQFARSSSGGTINYAQTFYTLEKADGSFAFLNNGATLNKFRETFKEFYANYSTVQPLIESKFQSRYLMMADAKEIMEAVNKL